MEKNKKYSRNYMYGSTAYDLQPEINKEKKQKNVKKPRKNSKAKFKLMGSVIAISFLSLFILTRFASIVKLTYDVRSIKSEIRKVQEENDNIKVEMAKLNNIKSIEKMAVGKLGMVVPDKKQVVYIDVKPLTSLKENKELKTASEAGKVVQKIFGLIH
jgi:cell division protein FtsL